MDSMSCKHHSCWPCKIVSLWQKDLKLNCQVPLAQDVLSVAQIVVICTQQLHSWFESQHRWNIQLSEDSWCMIEKSMTLFSPKLNNKTCFSRDALDTFLWWPNDNDVTKSALLAFIECNNKKQSCCSAIVFVWQALTELDVVCISQKSRLGRLKMQQKCWLVGKHVKLQTFDTNGCPTPPKQRTATKWKGKLLQSPQEHLHSAKWIWCQWSHCFSKSWSCEFAVVKLERPEPLHIILEVKISCFSWQMQIIALFCELWHRSANNWNETQMLHHFLYRSVLEDVCMCNNGVFEAPTSRSPTTHSEQQRCHDFWQTDLLHQNRSLQEASPMPAMEMTHKLGKQVWPPKLNDNTNVWLREQRLFHDVPVADHLFDISHGRKLMPSHLSTIDENKTSIGSAFPSMFFIHSCQSWQSLLLAVFLPLCHKDMTRTLEGTQSLKKGPTKTM